MADVLFLATLSDIAPFAIREEAHEVIPDLALIDWLALVFAAVLLAAAVAAALLAYLTSRARTSEPTSGYAHAAASSSVTAGSRDPRADADGAREHAKQGAAVIDLTDHEPEHATSSTPPTSESAMAPADVQTVDLGALFSRSTDDADVAPAATLATESTLAERAERIRNRRREANAIEPENSELAGEILDEDASGDADRDEVPPAVWVPESRSARQRVEDTKRGFATRDPGFFEDPLGRHELRYWDGASWTEYVKESGERFTDPL